MTEVAKQGNEKKSKKIEQILHKERDECTFHKITQALGKQKQGLTELVVPDVEGGKTTLYTKEAIDEVLLKWNQGHFQQANDTPFSSQGTGAPMVDPDNVENIVEEILNGNFEPWPGICYQTHGPLRYGSLGEGTLYTEHRAEKSCTSYTTSETMIKAFINLLPC